VFFFFYKQRNLFQKRQLQEMKMHLKIQDVLYLTITTKRYQINNQ